MVQIDQLVYKAEIVFLRDGEELRGIIMGQPRNGSSSAYRVKSEDGNNYMVESNNILRMASEPAPKKKRKPKP